MCGRRSGPETELSLTRAAPLLAAEPGYAGQPIAVVAADTLEAAREGVRALALDIEQLGHIVDPREAVNEQHFIGEPGDDSRGDAEAALAAAEVTVEVSISTSAQLQAPLEPHAAVASWDGEQLTAWVSTQGMFSAREELAAAFGLRKDDVRVRTEFVGGGFGGKQGAGFEALAAAELARITGRPVRLVNDRHGEMLDGGRRFSTEQTYRLGANRDGTLTAIEAEAVLGMGQGGWAMPALIPARTLYRCADVSAFSFPAAHQSAAGERVPGTGVMEGTAVFEQAIDELARALEMDPLELRRRNHADVDQVSGLPYSSKQLLACYDRAAELAGWEEREQLRARERRRAPARDGVRDADLVGRRRASVARDDPPRRRRARVRRDRDPGHRHRHADERADRRG